jgi:type IV pilus assembly protein PilB
VKLHDFDIDPVCVNYLPQEVARKTHAIPLLLVKNRLVVAVNDPTDSEAISMLRFASGHNIELVIATDGDVEWAIRKYYGTLEDEEILRKIDEEKEDDEVEIALGEYERIGQEKPIVRLVHNLIVDAIHRKASDIHIRPEKDHADLIYRIDGTLIKIRKFSKSLLPALVSRIKILGRMDIAERRLPQDGRSQYLTDDAAVELRISIMPTVDGESVVIRILNIEVGLKTIQELGFGEKDQTDLLDMLHKSFGMFLVTGPTGSGKSTTLYAALQEIQKQNVNIITVEDPVEYHMGNVEQIQINPVIGYDFARALRNILRHDPDVIMVGEIRDEETAKIAVESALTGHLLLSTLHTNDAPSTIARLLEMEVEPYLLNTCLLGVLAQRLVRRNCQHCLKEEPVDQNIRKVLGVDRDEVFYHGEGCDECNKTGYSGRLGVYELLVVTDGIRKNIRKGVTADEIRNVAIQEGMIPLTQNSLEIARQRLISLSEVYRVRLE